MGKLSIKVTIGNRIYPLTIAESEKANVMAAVDKINDLIQQFEQNYAVKDKQDLLAMAALQFATQKIELEQSELAVDNSVPQELKDLDNYLAEYLSAL